MKNPIAVTLMLSGLALAVLVVVAQLQVDEVSAQAENAAQSSNPVEGLIVDPDAATRTNVATWTKPLGPVTYRSVESRVLTLIATLSA